MGVSVRVGDRSYEIGAASFFKAFFATICVRLENERWGKRFPVLMHGVYTGRLPPYDAQSALQELTSVRSELEGYGPDQLVWDFDNRSAQPPWGDRIAPEITSLANYFVTSDGKDLFEVLRLAFATSISSWEPAIIE